MDSYFRMAEKSVKIKPHFIYIYMSLYYIKDSISISIYLYKSMSLDYIKKIYISITIYKSIYLYLIWIFDFCIFQSRRRQEERKTERKNSGSGLAPSLVALTSCSPDVSCLLLVVGGYELLP